MNNVRHDSAWNTKYGEHFGFSNEELDAVIDKAHSITHNKFDKKDAKKKITKLYNGYKINNKMIYNPFSVMHCIYGIISGIEKPYQNYWANSGSLDIIIDALNKIPISTNIDNLFKTGEVMFIPKEETEVDKISFDEQAFLTTLLDAGYLTKADKDNHYKIPNHEVRCEFYEKLNRIWINRVKDIYFQGIISKDEFENSEIFLKEFEEKVLRFIKGVAEPEAHFQNLIYLSLIKTNMEVVQEKLTEIRTKIGLVVYPLNDLKKLEDTVYIIEIKLKGGNRKNYVLNEGLGQIFVKNYAEDEMNKNENLKIVVLRVVIFEYTESFKWKMSIAELKFTRENLKEAIELYRPKFEGSKKWKNAFEDIVGFSFSNKKI